MPVHVKIWNSIYSKSLSTTCKSGSTVQWENKAYLYFLCMGLGLLGSIRDNIKSLAEGNRVWALSLLGFGRSEKPDVVYTQDLWAELIRDFIVEVIGEPVVLVGNSIGGTFCL